MSEQRHRKESATSRYSNDEFDAVKRRAATVGLTVGQYQRAAALHLAELPLPHVRRRPTPDLQALSQLLAQIGRVGGNLNQIARALNTGHAVPSRELAEIRADIAEIRAAVRISLGHEP